MTPIKTTEAVSVQPVITCTITAVAKNLIPSARTRVIRKINEETF